MPHALPYSYLVHTSADCNCVQQFALSKIKYMYITSYQLCIEVLVSAVGDGGQQLYSQKLQTPSQNITYTCMHNTQETFVN